MVALEELVTQEGIKAFQIGTQERIDFSAVDNLADVKELILLQTVSAMDDVDTLGDYIGKDLEVKLFIENPTEGRPEIEDTYTINFVGQ